MCGGVIILPPTLAKSSYWLICFLMLSVPSKQIFRTCFSLWARQFLDFELDFCPVTSPSDELKKKYFLVIFLSLIINAGVMSLSALNITPGNPSPSDLLFYIDILTLFREISVFLLKFTSQSQTSVIYICPVSKDEF